MNIRIVLALFFSLFVLYKFCSLTQFNGKNLQRSFSELENDPAIKNGIVSLSVMDANSGQVIFAKNEEIGLAPASTLKTITTITAYTVLGRRF